VAGDETATLLGALERLRRTFEWKCGGVDEAGQRARLAPSTLTLGGLVKHLALVEEDTFSVKFLGRPMVAPFDAIDWNADPDWEWRTGAQDDAEQLFGLYHQVLERSRAVVVTALEGEGLDAVGAHTSRSGEHPNLRRLLVDLIEEYARHLGHADLIRESVDGLTGEDPG
jgi:hypothetical protein